MRRQSAGPRASLPFPRRALVPRRFAVRDMRSATKLFLIALTVWAGAVCWSGARGQELPSDVQIADRASRWFGGPLGNLPEETKHRLVRLASATPGGVRALTSERFRRRLYLEVLMNTGLQEDHSKDDLVGKVDRLASVAVVANDRLLPALKSYADALGSAGGIDGIKLFLIELPANSFVQLYAPLTAVNRYRAGRLTPQQLIDRCIVFINNDRVRLTLPGQPVS